MSTDKPDATIAVFERHSYWGPELKRQFGNTPFVIRECRSVSDLEQLVSEFKPALLVLDLDAGIEDCLAWLSRQFDRRPRCISVVACGSPTTSALEWSLRELGVSVFLPDVIPGDQFARICRWQVGLQSKASP